MKRFKFPPLLALIMSFQMMIAPVAGAQTNLLSIINTASQLYNQTSGGGMSANYQSDLSAFRNQQTPGTDKYFNAQKMSQIPGLAEYLALNNINPQSLSCSTLATTLHEARNEVCMIGLTSDRGVAPQAQMGEMYTYADQYYQIKKLYENYSATSNTEGQGFGVGCMNNAMRVLQGFFAYRLNELDKLVTNLEALNNQFREASMADLNAIEEATGLLDGGALADSARARKPDLFDFSKRFENQACNSMYSGEDFTNFGSGGLNNIKAQIKAESSKTAQGSKYSGDSYGANHAAVVQDIMSLSDKASKQLELNFSSMPYAQMLTGMRSLSSTSGANGALTADFFSNVQTQYNESNNRLTTELSTIAGELRAAGVQDADSVTTLARNTNAGNFNNAVNAVENGIKNACLTRNLSSTSMDSLLERVIDPSGSAFANKNASNFVREKLRQILENKGTSLEKKLSELSTLESQTGSRYILRMNSSYEVQTVVDGKLKNTIVPATTRKTPAAYFADVINNCQAQFQSNTLGNTMSGASAVARLRKVNQDYKALATTQAAAIKKEITDRLISCSGQTDATNSTPRSCNATRFNTTSANFCANAAISCANNMKSCGDQAQAMITQLKTDRTARVTNYSNLMKKNKQDIVRIFDTALAKYMREGEAMRGMFGASFSSPTGINREVDENNRFINKFKTATAGKPDGQLLLEDPDKYVDMFKQNIASLKTQVQQQQNEILGSGGGRGGSGVLAQHIKQTEDNYRAVVQSATQYGDRCMEKHNAAVQMLAQQAQEAQKTQSELGEKRQQICALYSMAQSDPNGACSQEVMDLMTVDSAGIGNFRNICRQTGSDLTSDTGNESMSARAASICAADPIPTNIARECAQAVAAQCRSVTRDGNTVQEPEDCFNGDKDFVYQIIVNRSRPASSSDADSAESFNDAPAYCNAGDNSNRGMDMFNMFNGSNGQVAGQSGSRQ